MSIGCAEEVEGLFLAVGAAAVGFGGAKSCEKSGSRRALAQDDERVLAAGEVGVDIEAEGAAYGSLRTFGRPGRGAGL
jgi:hypothetical protein